MNRIIKNIKKLLFSLENSSREDRKQALRIWEDFRRAASEFTPPVDEIVEAIGWMRDHREWRFGEPLLVIAGKTQDPRVVSAICSIIELEEPEVPVENAIEYLADVRSQDSVPILIRVVGFRFKYDENLEIPIKALQALYEIGGQRALEFIRQVSTGEGGPLAGEAAELLAMKK